MAGNESFFTIRNAQAVLKHGLLGRYAHYFAGRAGKAANNRVAFIDGYAGAGRYEDGTPGSPLLLLDQASRAEKFGRDTVLSFIERDEAMRGKLVETLQEEGLTADCVVSGDASVGIPRLLRQHNDRAILLFIDPFGLGLPRSDLEAALKQSSVSRPLDVLYHFSILSIARMAPAALKAGGRDRNAAYLDAALGTDSWRERILEAKSQGGEQRATDVALKISAEFRDAVASATGMRATAIDVRQRPHHQPIYQLILFTRDPQAPWDYADMAGKACVDWLHHCEATDREQFLAAQEQRGELSLFQPEEPDRNEIDARLAESVIPELKDNLLSLLKTPPQVRLDVESFFGPTLGRARITHARKVLKELNSEGRIDDPGTGDFWKRPISLLDSSTDN